MRKLIWTGTPIVYGTHLYTDFGPYDGTPVPYAVGNGIYNRKPNGQKKGGHCMLIIGYDDTLGTVPNQGVFLIQNSFGLAWGQNGPLWMAYSTFQTMAEGGGSYITLMQTQGAR